MAYVIGPNGLKTEVPDRLVAPLVGNGDRGYRLPDPPAPVKKTPARKRAPKNKKGDE